MVSRLRGFWYAAGGSECQSWSMRKILRFVGQSEEVTEDTVRILRTHELTFSLLIHREAQSPVS